MAETDILNPDVRWDAKIQDAIGPDFGFQTMRRSQLATAKAAGGSPLYRTIGNEGHTGQFSWLNRSQKCVQKLKQWAEQHEDGFFTLIDHDWGGRHYVGNFVGDMPVTEAGNDRYNIQGWQFVETPGAPMLQYPGTNDEDWDNWAVRIGPFDDRGRLRCGVIGNWIRPAAVADDDGNLRQPNELQNQAPANGDSVTFEYRGYGFRVWADQGPAYASASVVVDGVDMGPLMLQAEAPSGSGVAYANASLSLDIHRVTILLHVAANVPSAGITLAALEVMR